MARSGQGFFVAIAWRKRRESNGSAGGRRVGWRYCISRDRPQAGGSVETIAVRSRSWCGAGFTAGPAGNREVVAWRVHQRTGRGLGDSTRKWRRRSSRECPWKRAEARFDREASRRRELGRADREKAIRAQVPSSGRCSKQDSRSQHLPSRTVPCSSPLPQGQHAASPRKMDRSRERMLESGPPVRITRFVARIDLVTHAVAALSDRPGKACWQLRQSRRGLERLPTGLVGDRSLAKPGSKARRVRNCVRGLVPQIEPVTLAPVEVAKAPVRLLTG